MTRRPFPRCGDTGATTPAASASNESTKMNPEFWNARFSEPEPAYGTEPNAFIASQADKILAGGAVLCLGEGEGRNAVWLASRGCRVTAIDYAEVAARRISGLAARRGQVVETHVADLTTYVPAPSSFDAVLSVFVHLPGPARRTMHRRAVDALRPGGVFLAEYFSKKQLAFDSGGPKNEALLISVDDLREDLHGTSARIELLEEVETDLNEGRYHRGRASTIRLVLIREA